MTVQLLTEDGLEFLSLKGDCTGLSTFTHVKCHIVGNYMMWLISITFVYMAASYCDINSFPATDETMSNVYLKPKVTLYCYL